MIDLLNTLEMMLTIGIAFDLQVFDSIPKENHDAQLNYVITENNMYIGKI